MTKKYQAPLGTAPNAKYSKNNFTIDLIKNKAKGRWLEILDSLGISPKYLINKHGPCPVCGGKDRFRFDNKDQCGTFFCNRCGAGDGFTLLQLFHGWDFKHVLDRVGRIIGMRPEDKSSGPQHISKILENLQIIKKVQNAREVLNKTWKEARPVEKGDPVSTYLKARGIELNRFPCMLRYHPQLPYYDNGKFLRKFPAMLGLVSDVNNHNVTIHRTYLGNNCKAHVSQPKKLMSPIRPGACQGAAIKLFEPLDGRLAVSEGIETAFSFHIKNQLPVWATISAVGMEKVILPPAASEIIIIVDNDKSGRGQKAAATLKKRLSAEGRKVKCVMPPKIGQDFNDVLLEAEYEC